MDDAFKKAAEEQMIRDLPNNIIVKETTILPPSQNSGNKDRSILIGGILVGGIVLMLSGIGGMMLFQNATTKEAVVRTFESEFEEDTQTSVVPTVPLREEYDNPFEESTAYVNPFSQDYNPFVLLDEGY